MPSENVELVERLYRDLQWLFTDEGAEAAKRGVEDSAVAIQAYRQIRELLAYLSEDVSWKVIFMPEPVVGHAEVVRTIGEWMEVMADWRVVDEHFTDASEDTVLGEVKAVLRGRGSDVPVEQVLHITYTIADGKITRYSEHFDRDEALASL